MATIFNRLPVACAVILAAMATSLRAQSTADLPRVHPAPAITPLRYTEDYSYLRDAAHRTTDPLQSLKFIPLSADGGTYLTLGGEARARYESYADNVLGSPSALHDDYLWIRALPYADLHVGANLRLFGELIWAFKTGDEPNGPVDEDRGDILQAFADLRIAAGERVDAPSFTLRPGRQLLSYGSERLIGTRYGPNVLQTFDAVKGVLRAGEFQADAFFARPVRVDPEPFDDEEDPARSVWGLYGTYLIPAIGPRSGVDLYTIGYDNSHAVFAQGSGREHRQTVGLRIFGQRSGWGWNYEGFYQFGDFRQVKGGRGDISAWSVATETAYTFEAALMKPQLGLRANVISGDRNAGDANLQAFNPLFPKGKYFGEIGLIGPYNLINVQPALILHPTDKLTLTTAAVFYWRQSLADGIYSNSGRLLRAPAGVDKRYIGTQLDFVAGYEFDRNWSIEGVYSAFLPGAFVRETGASDVVQFVGLEILFRF